MTADGAGRYPQRRVRVPMLRQTWSDVTFLHWRSDARALRPLVPAHLAIAAMDGTPWLSLVMFDASGTRGPFPTPSLPRFAETNLRTYVRDRRGREAVWFLTLEASSLPVVAGGRATCGVPYRLARTETQAGAGARRHRSSRGDPPVGHDIRVEVGDLVGEGERSALDDWLTGRWRAFSRLGNVDLEVAVEHEPWTLRHATVVELAENLVVACGLPPLEGSPLVHAADPVDARLAPPRPGAWAGRQ